MELRSHRKKVKAVRIILMGDRGIGKSSIIHASIGTKKVKCIKFRLARYYKFTMNFANEAVPMSILDMTDTTECIELWEFYECLRVDTVVLCYAVDDRKSFENIKTRWMQEARKYFNKAFIVLVGLRLDRMLEDTVVDPVFFREGDEIARKFLLKAFFTTSTLRKDAVNFLFLITLGRDVILSLFSPRYFKQLFTLN
ncbi:hypothetical protein TNIN_378331 [Trichonephila inaurata madagascariensis]|uniref:Uncharacterized protein n=1 Tax=Trichonephila inaurata madagascariensis TaxID=2747483 RepID=A0A8X6Y7B8_9ARAC|nr:hypothetical protein TNIN_378331 [Trichonephila inaurata madagascariensis]